MTKENKLDKKMFYDRKKILGLFKNQTDNLESLSEIHSMVLIWGAYGYGKTEVVNKYYKSYKNREIEKFFITLDNQYTPYNILYTIRDSLKCKCFRFDYALLIWMNKLQIASPDSNIYEKTRSNILAIIEHLNIPIVSQVAFCVSVLLDYSTQLSTYLNLTVEELKELHCLKDKSADEVMCELPDLLVKDLIQNYGNNQKILMVLDNFNAKHNGIDQSWILNRLLKLKQIVLIVTSREYFSINHHHNNNICCVDNKLQSLPASDAKKMLISYLEKYNLTDEDYEHLLYITYKIPKYLEIAIDTYNPSNNSDIIFIDDRQRFYISICNHIPNTYKILLEALSAINLFDSNMVDFFIRECSINLNWEEKEDFLKLSLIDEQENFNESTEHFYSIALPIAKNMWELMGDREVIHSFEIYKKYFYAFFFSFSIKQKEITLYNLFSALKIKAHLLSNIQFIELAIDIFLLYVEAGYYTELLEQFNGLGNAFADSALYTVIVGLCTAKLEGSEQALKIYSKIPPFERSTKLGKHKKTLELIEAYSYGIKGNYQKASNVINEIFNSLTSEEYDNWYYSKCYLYKGDTLFLCGQFKDSLMLFEELEHKIEGDPNKLYDLLELHKQKGHCFRFNFLLDTAMQMYENNLKQSCKNISMRNYFLTNLIETSCYGSKEYYNKYFKDALECNLMVKHQNNLGKIYYAKAIYLLSKKSYEESKLYIEKSIQLNENANYKSGKLFANIANAYWEFSKYGKVSERLIKSIESLLSQIKVYYFTILPLYLMNNDYDKVKQMKKNFQWIDYDKTISSIKVFIESLR